MAKVINLRPALDPDEVLKNAQGEYESVLIIGYDHEGQLDARASLNIDHKEALWLAEAFKNNLINGEYNSE